VRRGQRGGGGGQRAVGEVEAGERGQMTAWRREADDGGVGRTLALLCDGSRNRASHILYT
jgi:hypothetical protein